MSTTNRQKRRDLRLHATQTSMPKKEITPHLRWKMQTVRHSTRAIVLQRSNMSDWVIRQLVWTRCSTIPSRCRRRCQPSWQWAECRECWAHMSCQKDGSCMSRRPETWCSWACIPDDVPLESCWRLCWSFCGQCTETSHTLNTSNAYVVETLPKVSKICWKTAHERY